MDKSEEVAVMEVERLSKLGTARFQNGNRKKALEAYQDAYKASKALGQFGYIQRACAFNLGAMLISYEKYSEGLTYLNQAVPPKGKRDGRSNGDLYFNYGLAYEGLKRFTESLQNFSKALEEYRLEQTNTKMEADTIQRLKKLAKDAGLYQETDSWLRQLIATYNQMGEKEKSLQAQAEHARLLLEKLHQPEMAELVADQCFETLKDCQHSKILGYVLVELVLVHTQTNNYTKGIQRCEKALSMSIAEPKLSAVIFQNLGAIYNHLKQYQIAISFHVKAAERHAVLKDRRSQGHCFMNMGYAYSQLQDISKAGNCFLHALQAARDSGDKKTIWQSLESLGAVAFNQRQFSVAQAHYKDALTAFAESPEAGSKETQQRILSKLREIMTMQMPHLQGSAVKKGPLPQAEESEEDDEESEEENKKEEKKDAIEEDTGEDDGDSEEEGEEEEEYSSEEDYESEEKVSKEKESEEKKSEEKESKVEEPNMPPIYAKVKGSVFAVKKGNETKFLRVRRSGTLKKFKKVALGLDAGLHTQESQGPDICRVYKLDETDGANSDDHLGSSSSEISGDEKEKRNVRLEQGIPNNSVMEFMEGNKKRYVKLRSSGTLKKFMVSKSNNDGVQREKEQIYQVLESDGDLDPNDITSEDDDEKEKKSMKSRNQRPPDSFSKCPSHEGLSEFSSGSDEDEEVEAEDSEIEEKRKVMAAMAQYKDETITKKNEAEAKSQSGSDADSEDEYTGSEEESSDEETTKTRNTPPVPPMSPPGTTVPNTYENPVYDSENIYETIDHKPPSGRLEQKREVSFKDEFAERPKSRMGLNTPGADGSADDEKENNEAEESETEEEEDEKMSRGEREAAQYQSFQADQRARQKADKEKTQTNSKACVIM